MLDAIAKLNKTMDLLETDEAKFAETSQERKDELRVKFNQSIKPLIKAVEQNAKISDNPES